MEKTFESPLGYKEIKPVNPKGHQPWLFTGKTDAEAEAPILCPPDVKSQLIRKDPDAEKDWRQEEKGTTEDEELDGITELMDMSLSKLQEIVKVWKPGMLPFMMLQSVRYDWVTEQQQLLNL